MKNDMKIHANDCFILYATCVCVRYAVRMGFHTRIIMQIESSENRFNRWNAKSLFLTNRGKKGERRSKRKSWFSLFLVFIFGLQERYRSHNANNIFTKNIANDFIFPLKFHIVDFFPPFVYIHFQCNVIEAFECIYIEFPITYYCNKPHMRKCSTIEWIEMHK